MTYFLKENKLSEFPDWFSNNIYMMNDISVTLNQLLYIDIWYHINYLKYANNILAQILTYLLFDMNSIIKPPFKEVGVYCCAHVGLS